MGLFERLAPPAGGLVDVGPQGSEPAQDAVFLDRRISTLEMRLSTIESSLRTLEQQAMSSQRYLNLLRAPIIVTYGTNETPEFQRQNRDLLQE